MKIIIQNTSKLTTLNGVPARIWEGQTDSGIGVICFVTRIAVKEGEDCSQFEKELQEQKVPSAEVESFSLRMIL